MRIIRTPSEVEEDPYNRIDEKLTEPPEREHLVRHRGVREGASGSWCCTSHTSHYTQSSLRRALGLPPLMPSPTCGRSPIL